MPSESTSVRLVPVEPIPRSEMPWVVGLAAKLEERRSSVKPGTMRSRSSMLTPGMRFSSGVPSVVMEAGLSEATLSLTVICVRTGSGLAGGAGIWAMPGVWARAAAKKYHKSFICIGGEPGIGHVTGRV